MRQYIRGATIVNGDGHTPPFLGDVLIENDRIVSLGSVARSDANAADRKIEAGGRALAPGFVDTHNHGALGGTMIGDSGLPRSCELAILAGVTKRICGVDSIIVRYIRRLAAKPRKKPPNSINALRAICKTDIGPLMLPPGPPRPPPGGLFICVASLPLCVSSTAAR
jgi:N-acyl-D-aspartate/D-glutamate deacylase